MPDSCNCRLRLPTGQGALVVADGVSESVGVPGVVDGDSGGADGDSGGVGVPGVVDDEVPGVDTPETKK